MTPNPEFSASYHLRTLEVIIRDESKTIVYNTDKKMFESVEISMPLSCEQTDDINTIASHMEELILQNKIPFSCIEQVLNALKHRITYEKKQVGFFSRLMKKTQKQQNYSILQKSVIKASEEIAGKIGAETANALYDDNILSLGNNQFASIADFKHAMHISKNDSFNNTPIKNISKVSSSISSIHILGFIMQELFYIEDQSIEKLYNVRNNALSILFSLTIKSFGKKIRLHTPSNSEIHVLNKLLYDVIKSSISDAHTIIINSFANAILHKEKQIDISNIQSEAGKILAGTLIKIKPEKRRLFDNFIILQINNIITTLSTSSQKQPESKNIDHAINTIFKNDTQIANRLFISLLNDWFLDNTETLPQMWQVQYSQEPRTKRVLSWISSIFS